MDEHVRWEYLAADLRLLADEMQHRVDAVREASEVLEDKAVDARLELRRKDLMDRAKRVIRAD